MSGVFGPRKRGLSGLFACILCAGGSVAGAAQAETFDVRIDQARIMRLPDKVATIIIGNPLIADVALQAGGILVVTGKGYGATNMLALDRSGKVIMDKSVQVLSPQGAGLVTVYKGVERESYSCSPECAARITLGDSNAYFGNSLGQSSARTNAGQTAGAAAGAAH
jgi:Flp pilus assembly secretin CpaC